MNRVIAVLVLVLVAVLALVLAGCSDGKVEIKNTDVTFRLTILDERPKHWPERQVGLTTQYGGLYHVEILRAYYPECLEHEVRHVVEKDWHGDRAESCRPQRLQSDS